MDNVNPFLSSPEGCSPVRQIIAAQTPDNDDRATDIRLDQYYTLRSVAAGCYAVLKEHVDPGSVLMVEPSAGEGSFLRVLPPDSLAYDRDPKFPGITMADFLTVKISSDRKIVVVGNPPFGKNAGMAVRFFNHAAREASIIAFILPQTFRKASIQNRLDRAFHLIREESMPRDAFLFRGKPYDVRTTFQIWERREEPRPLRRVETRHPDFEFTTPERADFAIQRVGARAGRVHHDLTMSPSSHHFIRGNVEASMARLDFSSVAANVAGNPSLAKSEIIALYREYLETPVAA